MDYSQLSTFQTCPERYHLKYVENLEKIKDSPYDAPLQFGNAIHIALAAHYKGKDHAEAQAAFLTAYPDVLDPTDLARTPVNGVTLLSAYFSHYAGVDQSWKVLAVEVYDQWELQPGFLFEVKLDMIVETEGGIWGVDHKTTAKTLNEQYWRQYEPNSQLSGYTAYLQQKYGQCAGMIINGIKCGYRQRAYKGDPAGFHYEFQRQIFNRTQQQLEDWQQNTLKSWQRLQATELSQQWEKNETQCFFCQYRELCMSCNDPSVREVLYQRVEDPRAYLTGRGE